jgi:hypothetical protein
VTRKNLLFLGSDRGGERAAILCTLIETAKLNGLNPEPYLANAIDHLARGYLTSRLSELLPWNCKNAAVAQAASNRTVNRWSSAHAYERAAEVLLNRPIKERLLVQASADTLIEERNFINPMAGEVWLEFVKSRLLSIA